MSVKKSVQGSETCFETEFAGKKLIFKTGHLAQQAHASCTVQLGDTVVLATVVMASDPREGVDFFPLMVDIEERLYAAGKIKGSRWIKREGRPSDEAILTARLIDRSIRPLFPDGLTNDVQVIITVLSVDGENDSDITGLIAASTVLALSPIPWHGPIGGVRVAQIPSSDDPAKFEWAINPTFAAREKCALDMVIAGLADGVLMIEAGASEASEQAAMEAIEFAQKPIRQLIDIIQHVVKEVGQPKHMPKVAIEEASTPESTKELITKTQAWLEANVPKKLFDQSLQSKGARKAALYELKNELMAHLQKENIGKERRKAADPLFDAYVEESVTSHILKQEKRVDGRRVDELRPLQVQVGMLPRTHGSGMFMRGETQVLSVVTLGSPGDEQMLEGIETNGKKRYMHHYNFPSYSVGETGPIRSPGRREIGHGALAEKALIPMLPTKEEFPYTIRVVSEVLGSNGSSSMASVCGSTLSLMDAGVPIKKPVAGIAMGLASDTKGNFKVLTDLQDLEDGTGGMDFKIAGTRDGITAIQLDTKKTDGLSMEICRQTLTQAKAARQQILDTIAQVLERPRPELSQYAPRIITFKIDPAKIREVIGSGGKVINEIIEKTGVQIDIDPAGIVFITAVSAEGGAKAESIIKNIVRDLEVGEVFEGKVSRIMDFGAIVELLPGKDGMVHISELAPHRVNQVEDIVKLGDTVKVKVIKVEDGKVGLSIKALDPNYDASADDRYMPREPRRGNGFGRRNPRSNFRR